MQRTSEHLVLAAARRLVSPAEDGTDGIFAFVHPSAKRQLAAAMAGTLRDHASMLEGGQVLAVTEYGDRSATVAVKTREARVLLISGMTHEAGDSLIGLGVRLLPTEGQSWDATAPSVGFVTGVSVGGERRADCHGWRSVARDPPIDRSTPFAAGSIAKLVTATGVLLMAEDGQIELDSPIASYLPWSIIDDGDRGPSVLDVLHHRAGLPRPGATAPSDGQWPDRERLRRAMRAGRAGTSSYSNVGYELLGVVLEQRTGMPVGEWLHERVLVPIGLTASGLYEPDAILRLCGSGYRIEAGFVYPAETDLIAPAAAGLITTIDDLLRLGEWIAGTFRDGGAPWRNVVERLWSIDCCGAGGSADPVSRYFGGSLHGWNAGLTVDRHRGVGATLANTGNYNALAAAKAELERVAGRLVIPATGVDLDDETVRSWREAGER